MPEEDFTPVTEARTKAEGLEQQAGELATKATTLPDLVGSALRQKFGEENPLIQQRGTALQDYLTAGERAQTGLLPQNAPGGTVFSPTERRELVSKEQAAAVTPLVNLNTIIGQAYGGIQNITDAATRAYQAQVQTAQGAAGQARQGYQDVLNEYMQRQQLGLQGRELGLKEQELAQQGQLTREELALRG